MTTPNVQRTDRMNKVILRFCLDLGDRLGHKDLVDSLAAEAGQLDARPLGVDGRTTSWTDERRKQTGERIAKAWAAKREAKGLGDTFYQYKFADEKPLVLKGKTALAEAAGLSPLTIHNKLSQAPRGFIIKQGRHHLVFARNEEDCDYLLQAAYQLSGNPDDLIELPYKKGGRY